MMKSSRLNHDAVGEPQGAIEQNPDVAAVLRLGEVAKNDLSDGFRLAMRELASGVCVVTTGQGADRAGLTATSVNSLSLTPPSLLVSIQCTSRALKALLAFGVFGVNLLTLDQKDIADRFSGRGGLHGATRFDGSDWKTGAAGVPLLPSALAAVECTIERVMEWHTHRVIVGMVSSVLVRGEGHALVYWRGRYAAPAEGQLLRDFQSFTDRRAAADGPDAQPRLI
jgi:flavin reductase (DIM6/NTAB) family NADH-FMN oxidoreductase RutF